VCRNIKPLFNFEPVVTDDEIHNAALQFVRKVSGYNKPSRVNEAAFNRGVAEVSRVTREMIDALVTDAPPRDRVVEAERARERSKRRFGAA
jgi:hypothetical protein